MSSRQGNSLTSVSSIPLQRVHDQTLQFSQVGVLYTCIQPSYFPEHHDPKLKIAIPLKSALIQASWETATGKQKQKWIKPGHVSIIPAHQPREIFWQHEASLLSIYLDLNLMAQVAEDVNLSNVEIVEQWTARDSFIQNLGSALQTEMNNRSVSELYVESMANLLAVHILRHYSTVQATSNDHHPTLSEHRLQEAINYIYAHIAQNMTLNSIAEVVQMSPGHFSRAFKQATGQSPYQYVLKLRVECAKTLLARSELSISEISYQLGFSSQSHFTSTFKRFLAVTPKAYREAL